jgi:hypothetical protein
MDCKIINAKNVQEANHEDQGYIIKVRHLQLVAACLRLHPRSLRRFLPLLRPQDGIIVLCKDAIIAAGTVI